jgi:hypothetical protein
MAGQRSQQSTNKGQRSMTLIKHKANNKQQTQKEGKGKGKERQKKKV